MFKRLKRRRRFFSPKEEMEIIMAIRHAERQTTGEIRVHIQHFVIADPVTDALAAFHRLKMDRTKDRNGVIFFIVPEKRRFAIYGDEGIHRVVTSDFWDEIKDILETSFRKGAFKDGLIRAIERTGEKLKAYFPADGTDHNELPDDISYG